MAAESSHDRSSGDSLDAAGSTCATAAIRFRIGGSLRFLSHAETLRVLQRACSRAALPLRYTAGFNPHPRLSLPLPRPVGVEAEDELLVARVHGEQGAGAGGHGSEPEAVIERALAAELPEGMEVLGVALCASNAAFQPQWAEYMLPLQLEERRGLEDRVGHAVSTVMAGESCMVERTVPGRRRVRRIDVRPFLRSVRLEAAGLAVQCRTGPAGSIRIDEIMEVFGLEVEDLAGPVRRTYIAWETRQREQTSHPLDGEEEDSDDDT